MAAVANAVSAEDVVRDATHWDETPAGRDAWLEDAAACLRRNGVVVLEGAIPADVVGGVFEDFKTRHDVHMAPGQKKLFRTFQSDPLRAQVPVAVDGPLANPQVFAPPAVHALVRKMMGADPIIGEMGVVITHAGAGAQETHRDSNFLFGGLDAEIDLPPYSMTMLAPLRDVSLDMGPTEFWPGTHRIRDEAAATAGPSTRMPLKAGSLVLLDSRTFHRGGAHVAGPVRPSVYFSFHRSWYVENPGYENKPQVRVTPSMLQRLPEEYRPLFAWALHLNRTGSFEEFMFRWTGRVRQRLLRLKRR